MRKILAKTVAAAALFLVLGAPARADLPANLSSLDPNGLVGLADQVRGSPEDLEALAGYIETRYFADAATTRQISPSQWFQLVFRLAERSTPQRRALWADKLCAAFVSDAQVLVGLSMREMCVARDFLHRLGQGQTQDILTGWAAGADLGRLDPNECQSLSVMLGIAGESGNSARARLADAMISKYVANGGQGMSGLTVDNLTCLAGSLTGLRTSDKSQADRVTEAFKAVVGQLGTVMLADPSALAKTPGRQLRQRVAMMGAARDSRGGRVVATWVNGNDEWKTWNAVDLTWLSGDLRTAEGDDAEAARRQLISQFAGTVLADAPSVRSLPCEQWSWLVLRLGRSLTAGEKTAWIGRLHEGYSNDPNTLGGLKAFDAGCLLAALGGLGDSQVPAVAWIWLQHTSDMGSSARQLTEISHLAAGYGGSSQDKAAVVAKLETALEAAGGTYSPARQGEWLGVVKTLVELGEIDKAKQWAMAGYQAALGSDEARAAADAQTLSWAANLLSTASMMDQGYVAYAQVLARLAHEGKLGDSLAAMVDSGGPLGTPETRSIVEAEVADPNGCARLAVAGILSRAYRGTNELAAWKAKLDQRIAAAGDTGDLKAGWLLARAYAETLTQVHPYPLRGKDLLNQALAAAQSPSLRFQAVKALVDGYAAIDRHDQGVALLDSVAGQFDGTEMTSAVQKLRQDTLNGKQQMEQGLLVSKAAQESRNLRAWQDEMSRRAGAAAGGNR
jgi:hypothetical protein